MRTDSQSKLAATASSNTSTSDSNDAVKVCRKSLHPLQVAAGDKENLVGAGRMITNTVEGDSKAIWSNKVSTSSVLSPPKKEKKKASKVKTDSKVKVDDLTTEGEPSENYWKLLAETRRKALEQALIENEELHEKVDKLEQKIETYKKLMEEAQDVIDTLNEVLAESNPDDSGVGEEVLQGR